MVVPQLPGSSRQFFYRLATLPIESTSATAGPGHIRLVCTRGRADPPPLDRREIRCARLSARAV